jgi:hypothetical protein
MSVWVVAGLDDHQGWLETEERVRVRRPTRVRGRSPRLVVEPEVEEVSRSSRLLPLPLLRLVPSVATTRSLASRRLPLRLGFSLSPLPLPASVPTMAFSFSALCTLAVEAAVVGLAVLVSFGAVGGADEDDDVGLNSKLVTSARAWDEAEDAVDVDVDGAEVAEIGAGSSSTEGAAVDTASAAEEEKASPCWLFLA